eukprot:792664_1
MSQETIHNNRYNYVIVGGGIAGVTCCEQLIAIHNERKTHHSIALISAHPLLKAVSKLQKISQYLMDIEVTEYSSQQFMDKYAPSQPDDKSNKYTKLSIFHGYVTHINHIQRTITYTTSNHDHTFTISYHKCLIATGGSPKRFHIQNTTQKHHLIHALRDSETVDNFSKILSSSACRSIMIVGNGGISMELVYTLLKHKRDHPLRILWVIKHNHMGNTFLDSASSAFLIPTLFPKNDPQINTKRMDHMKVFSDICSSNTKDIKHGGAVGPRWVGNLSKASKQRPLWMDHTDVTDANEQKQEHEDHGAFPNELILKMNCDVSCIEEIECKTNVQLKVMLTNGETLIVDQLLCAMGVVPNTSFCDEKVFNKTCSNELIVNEYLETSVNGVYCAGDCCQVQLDEETQWIQMKLWSQSQRMGWIAAQAMACETLEEKENNIHLQFNFELFAHITKFFGRKCVFFGKYNAKKNEKLGIKILMRVKPDEEFVKLIVQNGRVIGAVLIGDTDLEETFENLILNKTDISYYGDDFLKFNVDLEAMLIKIKLTSLLTLYLSSLRGKARSTTRHEMTIQQIDVINLPWHKWKTQS